MATVEYRLFFNNTPATQPQLDLVEEITVEQEVDMMWEARLKIPICTDEKGNWSGESDAFLASFTRLRIEIKVGAKSAFVALIDGPIVGYDSSTSSEPGQSSLMVIVRDDSVYLHQNESVARFDGQTDDQIATQIYGQATQIAATDVESTPAPSSTVPVSVVQRGTAMQILSAIATRQDMHAYVLPGTDPGQSVGAFKAFPKIKDGLPDLILLGKDRNLATFSVKSNETSPATVSASSLSLTDKAVVTKTSSFRNLDLLGSDAGFQNESNTGTRMLPPTDEDSVDVENRVQAEASRLSYSFEASGSVMGDCYTGVLSPYRLVTVLGVNGRSSGDYVLKKVTHSLTRSVYSQSFSLLRNARSAGAGAAQSGPEGIF